MLAPGLSFSAPAACFPSLPLWHLKSPSSPLSPCFARFNDPPPPQKKTCNEIKMGGLMDRGSVIRGAETTHPPIPPPPPPRNQKSPVPPPPNAPDRQTSRQTDRAGWLPWLPWVKTPSYPHPAHEWMRHRAALPWLAFFTHHPPSPPPLLPLDGGGRLGGAVVRATVDALHFVDDTRGYPRVMVLNYVGGWGCIWSFIVTLCVSILGGGHSPQHQPHCTPPQKATTIQNGHTPPVYA